MLEGAEMVEMSSSLFTVGVFQDAGSAEKGLQALLAQEFSTEILSLIAKHSLEVEELCKSAIGIAASTMEIHGLGSTCVHGPIIEALQGSDRLLTRCGIGVSAKRIGFQLHDGQIFETLTARGGVLVAVATDARASDALTVLLSYGGGNAAISAWLGRV